MVGVAESNGEPTEGIRMDRRKFLLGLVGGVAVAAGLAGRTQPAEALPITPDPLSPPGPSDVETAVATPEDIEAAQVQAAQWGRPATPLLAPSLLAPPVLGSPLLLWPAPPVLAPSLLAPPLLVKVILGAPNENGGSAAVCITAPRSSSWSVATLSD